MVMSKENVCERVQARDRYANEYKKLMPLSITSVDGMVEQQMTNTTSITPTKIAVML
jgi:hypothetical protein